MQVQELYERVLRIFVSTNSAFDVTSLGTYCSIPLQSIKFRRRQTIKNIATIEGWHDWCAFERRKQHFFFYSIRLKRVSDQRYSSWLNHHQHRRHHFGREPFYSWLWSISIFKFQSSNFFASICLFSPSPYLDNGFGLFFFFFPSGTFVRFVFTWLREKNNLIKIESRSVQIPKW